MEDVCNRFTNGFLQGFHLIYSFKKTQQETETTILLLRTDKAAQTGNSFANFVSFIQSEWSGM
jgi:hypothetical protein